MMDRLTERDESPCMCCDGIDSCRVSCGNKKIYDKLQHYEDLAEAGQLVVLPKELVDKKNFIPKLARAFTNHFCPSEFGLKDGQCVNWRPYDSIMCYRCWEMALKGEW